MFNRSQPPLLIVDQDRRFLESIQVDAAAHMTEPVLASTAASGQAALYSGLRRFSGIFVNPAVSGATGIRVIRTAIEKHAGTPVYMLYDDKGAHDLPTEELERIAVHGAFHKPLSYARMIEIMAPPVDADELEPLLDQAFAAPEPVGSVLWSKGIEFVPIRAANFVSGKRSFFDLYIRIGVDKFIKIVRSGDPVDPTQLVGYLRKGLTFLYLRKEARAAYLNYCDYLVHRVTQKRKVPSPVKVSRAFNLGDETARFLRDRGVDDQTLRHALTFVDVTRDLVKRKDMSASPLLQKYLDNALLYEHGVATTLVAALLFKPLGITSERVQRMIGMAALLHDIGLCKLPEELQTKEEAVMTPEEKLFFAEHPRIGVDILREVDGIDDVVLQAVLQHHERRHGRGYPNGLGTGMITRVAELVGIADELVDLLLAARHDPSRRPYEEMKLRMFDGYSAEIVNAFARVLMPGESVAIVSADDRG